MILYTTMPLEQVLQGSNTNYANFREIQWEGRTLLVEQISVSQVRIERLVQSIHLSDYLDERYCPGQVITIG